MVLVVAAVEEEEVEEQEVVEEQEGIRDHYSRLVNPGWDLNAVTTKNRSPYETCAETRCA